MSVRLNPDLGFRDSARAALTFYHSVLGGTLSLTTFGEGGMSDDPAQADKIMHGQLEAPDGMTLMASDMPAGMEVPETSNISASPSGDDASLLTGCWHGLLAGGSVSLPLEKAPWATVSACCATGMVLPGWSISPIRPDRRSRHVP